MKILFVSSTISDLKKERLSIKKFFESQIHPEKFKVLISEATDFPIEPENTYKSVYEICIQNVRKANFFILLLSKNYGIKNQPFQDRLVSITHREYLEAIQKHIPIFVFVQNTLWQRYKLKNSNQSFKYKNQQEKFLLEFLNEIELSAQKKWIHHFTTTKNLKTTITSVLFSFDGSDIISDVTYPDGDKVTVNEKFQKIWRIKNTGMQLWNDRILKEENPNRNGLVPEQDTIVIPTTNPGEELDISIWFKAPKYPGSYISYWKMLDNTGRLCFPYKKGIWCRVNVVY